MTSDLRVVAIAAAALLLAGCTAGGGSEGGGSTPSLLPPTVESGMPSPSATSTTASAARARTELARLANTGATASYTGVYRLDPLAAGRPDATVVLRKAGSAYRVDVTTGGRTSLLMTLSTGPVACRVGPGVRTCVQLARGSTAVPRAFDPGVQRLVTSNLRAAARGLASVRVVDTGVRPAAGGLPAARCFRLGGAGIDAGEYCLTDRGVLRYAQFASGTLDLTRLAPPPTRAAFVPPARPLRVPR